MRSSTLLDAIVPPELSASLSAGTVVTIGNFDGVHLGHQKILQRLVETARARNAKALALTFEPHPTTLFQHRAPDTFRLTSATDRERLMRSYGIDVVVTIPFTEAFADLHPKEFVAGLLYERLHAKEVHIGYDFAFGRGREGTTSKLQTLCGELGVEVRIHPPYQASEEKISSTRVRETLLLHNIAEVTRLLGRPHSIPGVQESGAQRGREMGVPTINFYPKNLLMPPFGVYVTRLVEHDRLWPAVTSIGTRPTFQDDDRVSIETFVLDDNFPGTSYGDHLRIQLLRWIREELAFDSAEALERAMQKDIEIANSYHASHPPAAWHTAD